MTDSFIPFARPDYGDAELAELVQVAAGGWLTTGPRTAEFEREFKTYVGAAHALAVNSCTAGLHLALAALGIGPGDEIITTPLTFCATVNVVLEVGATPVLADIGHDFNIDPAAVRRLITPRTRALLPVHMAGLPCPMDDLWKLAAEFGLKVVEDAAHAAGSHYRGAPIGAGASDAVAFSFYATKNLSTGEGGMVTTQRAELEERMRILCLHGISRDAWNRYSEKGSWYYEVVDRGYKYNMSDLMAALGLVQLRKLEQMTARRIELASRFHQALAEMPELELPPDAADSRHCWHLYVLRLNLDRLGIDRAQFIQEMRQRGVGCSVHFIPIPLHPYYRRTLAMPDPCRRALDEYPRLVSLPLYSGMTDEEAERVIRSVRETVLEHRIASPVAMGKPLEPHAPETRV
jgi:dTDP-4-amino-4,6-dideoxygalactose transaminase